MISLHGPLFILSTPTHTHKSLDDALAANMSVGGESAARAMAIAAVLSAANGPSALLETEIYPQLRKREQIDAALQALQ